MQLLHACPAPALRSGLPSNVLHSTSRCYWYASLHEGEVCTLVLFHCHSHCIPLLTFRLELRLASKHSIIKLLMGGWVGGVGGGGGGGGGIVG